MASEAKEREAEPSKDFYPDDDKELTELLLDLASPEQKCQAALVHFSPKKSEFTRSLANVLVRYKKRHILVICGSEQDRQSIAGRVKGALKTFIHSGICRQDKSGIWLNQGSSIKVVSTGDDCCRGLSGNFIVCLVHDEKVLKEVVYPMLLAKGSVSVVFV